MNSFLPVRSANQQTIDSVEVKTLALLPDKPVPFYKEELKINWARERESWSYMVTPGLQFLFQERFMYFTLNSQWVKQVNSPWFWGQALGYRVMFALSFLFSVSMNLDFFLHISFTRKGNVCYSLE